MLWLALHFHSLSREAAQALADGLIVRKRDPSAELESLAGLAVIYLPFA